MDLTLNGFEFSSPVDIVSPQREHSRILPSVALFLFSSLRGFILCLLRVTDFALSGLSFHPQWIPCLLRENFHGFYPQWFSLYFKSPTVLSSKGPFTLLLWCVSVWTHEHRPTNGFVYWLSTFNAWGQLSQKRGTHPNLYWSILMVSGLNDNNLRFLIRWMCVETHLENSRKQVEKLPLT